MQLKQQQLVGGAEGTIGGCRGIMIFDRVAERPFYIYRVTDNEALVLVQDMLRHCLSVLCASSASGNDASSRERLMQSSYLSLNITSNMKYI